MAIPSVFPMFLKAVESEELVGTVIVGGLDVAVAGSMDVAVDRELTVDLLLDMDVPVAVGPLSVTLEDNLSVDLDVCPL